MELVWKKFNALGTELVVAAYLDEHQKFLLDKAEATAIEFEKRFSRFITTSELCQFNNFQGGKHRVSQLMLEILKRCQFYFNETNGLFDPAIIDTLEGAGYNKSFVELKDEVITHDEALRRREQGLTNYLKRPKVSEIKILSEELDIPAGTRLDFGGIGKGFLTDMLSREIFGDIESFWISAGGDLLLKGNEQGDSGWKIGVQNPLVPEKESFSINSKGEVIGIATSGVIKRHGISGGIEWHHIIDPRTGLSAQTDILSVTMVAPTAEQADVYAKYVLLLGKEQGLEFVNKHPELECAIFFKNTAPMFSSGLVKYL